MMIYFISKYHSFIELFDVLWYLNQVKINLNILLAKLNINNINLFINVILEI